MTEKSQKQTDLQQPAREALHSNAKAEDPATQSKEALSPNASVKMNNAQGHRHKHQDMSMAQRPAAEEPRSEPVPMSQHDMGHSGMSNMDHSMHMGNFKKKFWLSLGLAIPIIVLSPMMGMTLPFQFTFAGSDWLVLLLATVLFFYGGQPFFSGAKMELQMRTPGMMMLITLGISVAYFYSLYAFLAALFTNQHVMNFFWELATLIVIMLLGHWLEMSAVGRAGDALEKLAALLPSTVKRIDSHGGLSEVPLSEVQVNDRLQVAAGEKVPADGIIEQGTTSINEAALTGEAAAVKKTVGDRVIGGSVNGNGAFKMQVTSVGEESYLAQVMALVRQAQQEKSRLEGLSDRVAKWLFYVALAVGVLTLVIWWFLSDFATAVERMVTVFIIACPHALGLAIPLVVARSTSLAAKNGLLIKNRNALEQAGQVDLIALDKTGTLTEGTFTVTGIEIYDVDHSQAKLLAYLGALEQQSNHPLALGVLTYLQKRGITAATAENTQVIAGAGLAGVVDGHNVAIINEKELQRRQLAVGKDRWQKFLQQGNTVSFLVIDEQLAAVVALGDQVKAAAPRFIQTLQSTGIEPILLTGDNQEAAKAVAQYLGIQRFYAELLPNDKEKIIKQLVLEGKKVMMVGDGINDAPSLSRATVGVAIGAGTDIAIDAADVVLTASDPEDILQLLKLSQQTRRKMVQNLWWGAGYNLLAIPLAAGVLAPVGFLLSPAVGAVLMTLSTIIVAINALTLSLK